jgi:hypothetical protein
MERSRAGPAVWRARVGQAADSRHDSGGQSQPEPTFRFFIRPILSCLNKYFGQPSSAAGRNKFAQESILTFESIEAKVTVQLLLKLFGEFQRRGFKGQGCGDRGGQRAPWHLLMAATGGARKWDVARGAVRSPRAPLFLRPQHFSPAASQPNRVCRVRLMMLRRCLVLVDAGRAGGGSGGAGHHNTQPARPAPLPC